MAAHAGRTFTPWRDAAFSYVRLQENVRAADDNALRRIAEHARAMRLADWPQDVRNALLTRTYDSEAHSVAANPDHKDSIHIYWGKKEVHARNNEMNGKLPGPVIRSARQNQPVVCASSTSTAATGGDLARAEKDAQKHMPKLVVELMASNEAFDLKANTRIMVFENLGMHGVFNGALATVLRMTKKRVRGPRGEFYEVPAVRVRMDTTGSEVDIERRETAYSFTYYHGPTRRPENAVNVGVKCSWWPFTLGWAITYHKVQGKTIVGPLTLFVGNFRYWKQAGMLYVGVTRAQRLSQLALVPARTQRDRGAKMLDNGFCSDPLAVRFMTKLDTDAHFSEADEQAWSAHRAAPPAPSEEPEKPACVACLGKADCLLLPCAHMATCVRCMEAIRFTCKGRLPCPLCRGVATSTVRVLY